MTVGAHSLFVGPGHGQEVLRQSDNSGRLLIVDNLARRVFRVEQRFFGPEEEKQEDTGRVSGELVGGQCKHTCELGGEIITGDRALNEY